MQSGILQTNCLFCLYNTVFCGSQTPLPIITSFAIKMNVETVVSLRLYDALKEKQLLLTFTLLLLSRIEPRITRWMSCNVNNNYNKLKLVVKMTNLIFTVCLFTIHNLALYSKSTIYPLVCIVCLCDAEVSTKQFTIISFSIFSDTVRWAGIALTVEETKVWIGEVSYSNL